MKKILIFCLFGLIIFTGCGEKDSKNENSKLALVKNNMYENVKNYSYTVEITTNTGFMDVTTNMECVADINNSTNYCESTTYGSKIEEYLDYKNGITYSRTSVPLVGQVGNWTSTKTGVSDGSSWLSLNDYIFDIAEESKDDGTYFTGVIDSKKIATAMSQSDSNFDSSSIISDDIKISVFVNSSNYIERMSFTMEIMGMQEEIEITYSNFNESGSVIIPDEVKN